MQIMSYVYVNILIYIYIFIIDIYLVYKYIYNLGYLWVNAKREPIFIIFYLFGDFGDNFYFKSGLIAV